MESNEAMERQRREAALQAEPVRAPVKQLLAESRESTGDLSETSLEALHAALVLRATSLMRVEKLEAEEAAQRAFKL